MAKILPIIICFFFTAELLAISLDDVPTDKKGHIAEEILEMNPFMVQVGSYLDPITGSFKRYYSDTIPRTWAENKAYCNSLSMQPASPSSAGETSYLTLGSRITCEYSWTSGLDRLKWVWDMRIEVPIYAFPTWYMPNFPQCAVLHLGRDIHAIDCSTRQCTLCEQKF